MTKLNTHCKAIFFDAEGTLFRMRDSVGNVYAKVAEMHGIRADPDLLNRSFAEAWAKSFPFDLGVGSLEDRQEREVEGWRAIVGRVFQEVGPVQDFDALFRDIFEAFSGRTGWELYADAPDLLDFLRRNRVPLGIISNFDFRIESVTVALGIREFFDVLTTPGRAGAAKPDPKIFWSALDSLGVSPSEALHVGDSIASDIQGAKAVGITPILIDRDGRWASVPGVLKIGNLIDLKGIISFCAQP